MATKTEPKDRKIEFGSPEHAALVGLIPDKGSELGWKLADTTSYGPYATKEFLDSILRQKVNELTHKPSVPANAPELFDPAHLVK